MKKINLKDLLIDILVDVISGLLLGIALYNFAADALFPITGVSGIAMIFYHFYRLPIGLVSLLINVPIIIFSYKLLGRKFMLKSFKTMAISTVMIDCVAPLFPVYHGTDKMLTALAVGAITGLAYGIVYARNSSTGGADFVMMAIKAKRPHMSLGRIFLLVDVAVIVLGTVSYGNFDGLLYGFLISAVGSVVVDKVLITADSGKMILIVTNKAKEMADAVDAAVERGSTIIDAKGGWKEDYRQVLMCATSAKEMVTVCRVAKQIDVDAFMVIMESKEVYGEGFKRFKYK